jgi:predicted outer membrane repeat protein
MTSQNKAVRLLAAGLCAVLLFAILPVPQARAGTTYRIGTWTQWYDLDSDTFANGDEIIITDNIIAEGMVALKVPVGVTITIRGDRGMKTITGNSTFRLLAISSDVHTNTPGGRVKIDNLAFIGGKTFADGYAVGSDESHGGALVINGTATITNCDFEGNTATTSGHTGAGGALYVSGDATISGCDFVGNEAAGYQYGNGGALYIGGTAEVTDCTFRGNEAEGNSNASQGGALYVDGAMATITDCVFEGNNGQDSPGGSVYLDEGGTLIGCTFRNNTAPYGAAIYADDGSITIRDCAFEGNQATDSLSNGRGAVIQTHDKLFVEGTNIFVNNATGGCLDSVHGIGSHLYQLSLNDPGFFGEPVLNNSFVLAEDAEFLHEWPDSPDQTRTKQSLPAQVHGFGRQGLTLRVGETVFLPKIQNASLAGYWASASKAGYVDLALTLDGLTIRALKPGTVQLVLENDAVYAVMDVTIIP